MLEEKYKPNTTAKTHILIGQEVPNICPKCNEKMKIKKRGDFRLSTCPACGNEYFGQ